MDRRPFSKLGIRNYVNFRLRVLQMDCPLDSYVAIQDGNSRMGYVGCNDGAGSAVKAESEDREGGEGGSDVPDDQKL
ncbi:hypothetical protein GYMLUDRAFT_48044 [Collybiopsis luxurians FD-317 M1]|uniref:Uncharacterized protein n=1 Tax=Collybiopsis luxurians FD-317 M1 TaxID=944289 RepID=A0A0D0BYY1_9AGAR|nr:hypothetical protein GYMLUDRAFT_48044 [Collybiopsis luxurians FD-317 M1]